MENSLYYASYNAAGIGHSTVIWTRHIARMEQTTNPYKYFIIKHVAAKRLSAFQQKILLHEFCIEFFFVTLFHLWVSQDI
jgi:hypothetical protein